MSKREKCPKCGKDGEILPDKTERNDPKSLTGVGCGKGRNDTLSLKGSLFRPL